MLYFYGYTKNHKIYIFWGFYYQNKLHENF